MYIIYTVLLKLENDKKWVALTVKKNESLWHWEFILIYFLRSLKIRYSDGMYIIERVGYIQTEWDCIVILLVSVSYSFLREGYVSVVY